MDLSKLDDLVADVPVYEGSVFFPLLNDVLRILNTSNLLKHAYEQKRPHGALTWKTFSKFFRGSVLSGSIRQTTLSKLIRLFDSRPELAKVISDSIKETALWRPYHEWTGLLAGGLLAHPAGQAYWQPKLEAEWQLQCVDLGGGKPTLERTRIIAESQLSRELGCTDVRLRLLEYLDTAPEPEVLLQSTILREYWMSCICATLIRFAAWLVVDDSVLNWDVVNRDGQQDEIFLKFMLPRFNAQEKNWSNPVSDVLEHMARMSACPNDRSISAHLGEVWADHEFKYGGGKGPNSQITSKQRLIRNWEQSVGGRPEPTTVSGLCRAVVLAKAERETLDMTNLEPIVSSLVQGFVFAESCRFLVQHLSESGTPAAVLEAIFATYELEYRTARLAMGKPLPEPLK